MDGTLTVPQHDFEAIRAELGIPSGQLILEFIATLPAARAARMHEQLEAIEARIATESVPAPGLFELLDALQERGLPYGLLTRNSRRNAIISLRAIGALERFPEPLIAGREDAAPKPEPDGIALLAARLGLPVSAIAMVGDYRHDLAAGQRAGCYTVHLHHPGTDAWPELTSLRVQSLTELGARLASD